MEDNIINERKYLNEDTKELPKIKPERPEWNGYFEEENYRGLCLDNIYVYG